MNTLKKSCEVGGHPERTIPSQALTKEGVETRGDECSPVQCKLLTLEAHDIGNNDDIVRSIWEHIAAYNGAEAV